MWRRREKKIPHMGTRSKMIFTRWDFNYKAIHGNIFCTYRFLLELLGEWEGKWYFHRRFPPVRCVGFTPYSELHPSDNTHTVKHQNKNIQMWDGGELKNILFLFFCSIHAVWYTCYSKEQIQREEKIQPGDFSRWIFIRKIKNTTVFLLNYI